MRIGYRLKKRIAEEGAIHTAMYIIKAALYCLREVLYEITFDLLFSRKLLRGNYRTAYKHMGANDVYHTKYSVMPLIFRFVPIRKQDVLVDVGCGQGRMINYWLSRRLRNKIIGLELDPRVAKKTARNLSKCRNVHIITGDAIANLPEDGTIFYFYNPFVEEKVREFERIMSSRFINKPIRIVYYNPKSLHVFQNNRWSIRYINFDKDLGKKRWGRINKYHDLAIIYPRRKS